MAPSLPPDPVTVQVTFSAADFAVIREQARASGVTVEKYIRQFAVEQAHEDERLASKIPPPLPWPRRMVLVPPPVTGESFTSWMDAVARENLCGRNALLMEFWKVRRSPSSNTHLLAAALSEDDIARISAATGLPAEGITALLIRRYTDGIPALPTDGEWYEQARSFIMDYFFNANHSRWCPQCIEDNGGRWPLRWKLAWSYACPDHKVFLNVVCPDCRESQDSRNWPPDMRLWCPGQSRGGEGRRGGKRCGYPLAESTPQPVTDSRLIEVQRWINYGFGEGDRPGDGRNPRGLFVFPALVDLILRLRTPAMFGDADPVIAQATGDESRSYSMFTGLVSYRDQADPLIVAGAIYLADRLMTAKDRRAESDWFAALAREGQEARSRWDSEPLYVPPGIGQLVYPFVYEALLRQQVIRDSP
ncbi:TniQ family protein [Streptomyces sp. NPDC050509]|uniref:TniQ family protein n=1 Tax=Streptomyces sp. NPDC050509 TaxID=3365620 RepID=UPI0037B4D9F7